MFPVAFILLWIVSSTICTDQRQEIKLTYDSVKENNVTTLKCESHVFDLKDEWPTVIILQGTQKVWKHKCYNGKGIEWNVTTFMNSTNGAVGNVTTFVKGSTNKYSCKFYLHKNNGVIEPQVQLDDGTYTELSCSFIINMKYNWRHLTLEINSEPMKTKPEFHSNEVDSSYVYNYVENELVKVQCNKPTEEYGRLHFVYSGNNFNYSSVQKPQNSVSFEVVLGSKQNYSHVDCIYSQNSNIVTLRTYFFFKNRDAIRVDGLAIRGERDTLLYEYEGDLPPVNCPGTYAKLINLQNEHQAFDAKAECSVEGENKTLFIKKTMGDHGFYIEGVSIKNLVLKTCEVQSCIIYYEYTDGDVLRLKGSRDNVTCDRNDYLSSNGYYELKMEIDVNMKNITCFIAGNEALKTTLVFLVSEKPQEDKKPDESAGDDTMNVNSKDSKYIASDSNPGFTPNKGKTFFEDHPMLLAGIGLSLIILLLVLASLVCILRKRRKPTTEGVQSDVDYVNLDHKNNEQFPKRLNTDVYLKPEESSDYAVPVDNSIDANLYSVPYKPKPNEALYAKPVPKNQRYVNGDEVKYAAIAFKKPESMYTNVNKKGNTECAYAQVLVRPEDLYAKVLPKCERNDSAHPTYSNTAEYVEPSYCEVGALRK